MLENENKIIRVSAPARLHLGFLDLHGGLDRLFGSLGLSLHELALNLTVKASSSPAFTGLDAERVELCAERMLSHLNVRSGVHINVESSIPAHAGLGSGTQMALAVGVALNELFDGDLSLAEVAKVMDRGNRSGIGIGTFNKGGFIVDGGRATSTLLPPVISHLHFPDSWRFLLVMDKQREGVHGEQEKQVFGSLNKMDESVAAHLCRLVLMQVLPAIAESDCERFGAAIYEIQQQMGAIFSSAQNGMYTSKEVEMAMGYLHENGATGVGQTSWGPTGFAIFPSETRAYQALKDLRTWRKWDSELEYMICRAQNEPALVQFESEDATMHPSLREKV